MHTADEPGPSTNKLINKPAMLASSTTWTAADCWYDMLSIWPMTKDGRQLNFPSVLIGVIASPWKKLSSLLSIGDWFTSELVYTAETSYISNFKLKRKPYHRNLHKLCYLWESNPKPGYGRSILTCWLFADYDNASKGGGIVNPVTHADDLYRVLITYRVWDDTVSPGGPDLLLAAFAGYRPCSLFDKRLNSGCNWDMVLMLQAEDCFSGWVTSQKTNSYYYLDYLIVLDLFWLLY